MPSVEENLRVWDQSYDWTQEGNEWSAAWGGPEAEWFGTIFPRIHGFLPNGTILKINYKGEEKTAEVRHQQIYYEGSPCSPSQFPDSHKPQPRSRSRSITIAS